jgi:hypothetical protein
MPRRDTAALAAMSDPLRNRAFRRGYGWLQPPDPADSRTRRPARSASVIGIVISGNECDHTATLTPGQARAAGEALFARRAAQ